MTTGSMMREGYSYALHNTIIHALVSISVVSLLHCLNDYVQVEVEVVCLLEMLQQLLQQ